MLRGSLSWRVIRENRLLLKWLNVLRTSFSHTKNHAHERSCKFDLSQKPFCCGYALQIVGSFNRRDPHGFCVLWKENESSDPARSSRDADSSIHVSRPIRPDTKRTLKCETYVRNVFSWSNREMYLFESKSFQGLDDLSSLLELFSRSWMNEITARGNVCRVSEKTKVYLTQEYLLSLSWT